MGIISTGVIDILDISSKIDVELNTYYDIFKEIGVEYEDCKPQYVGKYLIYQYPDSLILTLEAKGNKLFYGYGD